MKRFIFYFLFTSIFPYNTKAYYVDILADTVCFGSSNTLTGITDITGTLIREFRWALYNDGYFDDATGEAIQYTFQNLVNNFINLRIITVDREEIERSEPKEINIYPIPVVNFTISNHCLGDSTQFEGFSEISSGEISNYMWDFNNDGNYETQLLPNPTYYYEVSDTFEIKLTVVSDPYCLASKIKSFVMYDTPSVDFAWTNTCFNDSTAFTNNLEFSDLNSTMFIWNFGDGIQKTTKDNPKHKYELPGTFEVDSS